MRGIVYAVVGASAFVGSWSRSAVAQTAPVEPLNVRVASVVGTASWSRGEPRLSVGAVLPARGRISISQGSRATLEMPDGARVTLGPGATLDLVDPALPREHPRTYSVRLLAGGAAIDRDPRSAHRGARATRLVVRSAAVSVDRGTSFVRVRSHSIASISAISGPSRVEFGTVTQFVRTGTALVLTAGAPPSRVSSLPSPPRWAIAPPATILWRDQGSSVSLGVLAPAGAPAESYRVQVATVEPSAVVVDDRIVPAGSDVALQIPQPGHFHVRMASIGPGGVEGRAGEPFSVTAVGPILRAATSHRTATVEIPAGIYCGLNGARMLATSTTVALAPARSHVIVCAETPDGPALARRVIGSDEAGPVHADVQILGDAPESAAASRVLSIRLRDAAGQPVSLANIRVEPPQGVVVTHVLECEHAGNYTATVFAHRAARGSLRVVINDVITREVSLSPARPSIAMLDRAR